MDEKENKNIADKHTAANKSIGFDYQYYVFLNKLLCLNDGECVGIEVYDDVHIESVDCKRTLIQVKHTVQKKVNGERINLSNKDSDFWKTLSIWCDITCDPDDGRNTKKKQVEYLENTRFVFFSNKTQSDQNKVVEMIEDGKKGVKDILEIRRYLQSIVKIKSTSETDRCINRILKLDDLVLSKFLKNIDFLYDEDSIINTIKDSISGHYVNRDRCEIVYKMIDSTLRENIYNAVDSGKKFEITKEEFKDQFEKFFEIARTKSLIKDISYFDITVPEDYREKIFIRQLDDIYQIDLDDEDEMLDYFIKYLGIINKTQEWVQGAEITQQELDDFHRRAVSEWRMNFRAIKGKIDNDRRAGIEIDDSRLINEAIDLYMIINRIRLNLSETELGDQLSNGEFLYLSDDLKIGWHYDWKGRYGTGV